jgi:hypothetical protein
VSLLSGCASTELQQKSIQSTNTQVPSLQGATNGTIANPDTAYNVRDEYFKRFPLAKKEPDSIMSSEPSFAPGSEEQPIAQLAPVPIPPPMVPGYAPQLKNAGKPISAHASNAAVAVPVPYRSQAVSSAKKADADDGVVGFSSDGVANLQDIGKRIVAILPGIEMFSIASLFVFMVIIRRRR